MSARRAWLLASLATASFLITAAPCVSEGAEDQTLAVIASRTFPVDDLSFGDLKRLYMGEFVNVGGKKVLPLTHPARAAERVRFDESVLGMSPEAAANYWIDRKIRGQSGPLKAIEPPEILVKVVAKVEGAIGYVHPGAVSGEVKVLRIDGKLPGDPGYRVGL